MQPVKSERDRGRRKGKKTSLRIEKAASAIFSPEPRGTDIVSLFHQPHMWRGNERVDWIGASAVQGEERATKT